MGHATRTQDHGYPRCAPTRRQDCAARAAGPHAFYNPRYGRPPRILMVRRVGRLLSQAPFQGRSTRGQSTGEYRAKTEIAGEKCMTINETNDAEHDHRGFGYPRGSAPRTALEAGPVPYLAWHGPVISTTRPTASSRNMARPSTRESSSSAGRALGNRHKAVKFQTGRQTPAPTPSPDRRGARQDPPARQGCLPTCLIAADLRPALHR